MNLNIEELMEKGIDIEAKFDINIGPKGINCKIKKDTNLIKEEVDQIELLIIKAYFRKVKEILGIPEYVVDSFYDCITKNFEKSKNYKFEVQTIKEN